MNHRDKILNGATTAFIDASYKSSAAYKPSFVSNTYGTKVLTTIEDELRRCDSFVFSVAFITLGGITPLLQTLKELEENGIPGKILTTDYNMFTDPKALDKLAELSNIELRMYREEAPLQLVYKATDEESLAVDTEKIGFHTKGYIFKNDGTFTILIGSSNMTQKALSVNKEWNTKVVSTAEGEMYQTVREAFEKLWNDNNHTQSYSDFIEEYRTRYETIKKQRKIALEAARNAAEEDGGSSQATATKAGVVSLEQYKLKPNSMQVDFINNLSKLVDDGEDKALLISATGTGKTYASAFGLRDAMGDNDGNVKSGFKNNSKKSNRILFIVHREQIAKQAMKPYKNVFGRSKTYEDCIFIEKSQDGDFEISKPLQKMIHNKEFYDIVKELLEFGRYRYERDYSKTYKDTELVLYQKYTYEDACRLLNWEHNEVPLNIGGYKYDKTTKTFPVFINYDKSDDIQDTIKYEDHFTSRSSLIAISKQSRTVESEDVQNFLHAKERGIDVELFVRKNKDDKISKEFYFLGRMTATGYTRPFTMPNTNKTAVEIEWKLDTPVREESCVIIGLTRKNPVKSMGCEVESYFFDQKNRYSEAA